MKEFLYPVMPIIKIVLFCFFIFACIIPFGLIEDLHLFSTENWNPLLADSLSETIAVLVVLGALLMIFRVFPSYNFDRLFFNHKKLISGFAKGSLVGLLVVSASVGMSFLNGSVSFKAGNISVAVFIGYIVLFLLVAVFEELIFRTFPLVVLAERYKNWTAIILTGLLFGIAHIGNEGFNWLSMVNISIVGVLFAVILLWKRNIYVLIGIHFGWNFSQGVLYGYQVSGTDSTGILVAKPIGSNYLSGGSFGIEASIFCTIVMVILLTYILLKHKIEPVIAAVQSNKETESDESN